MFDRRLCLACLFVMLAIIGASLSVTYGQRPARPVTAPPSPQSVLGFVPGDDRTIADWRQITDYFARLDKASDKVSVQTIGQSTLRRPIVAAFISARENMLALNRYSEIQRKLADPRTVRSQAEAERLFLDGKVVVAISCSIHSTEIVASQMSMQLAFELATNQDPKTREILQNTILILIPSSNPDGIDIVADWYRKTLRTPYEGREPPELYHHYAGHDDNRDWFMLNLKETQAITRLFWKEWFPQIVYDVHQMGPNGSRFFIPPFYDPPNPNISPLLLREVGVLGHRIAADLQAAGFKGVITNSTYDMWWHGGFRTAPYYHNSIGILSEAASARLMSPTTVTREQLARATSRGMRNALEPSTNFPDPWPGGQWRPRDIMNMEMIAARSILSLAARYRGEYLKNFYELGRANLASASEKDEPIGYLVPAGQARDEAVAKLIGTLIEQGVEVHRLDRELHAVFGAQILQRTNAASDKVGNYRTLIPHSTGFHEVPLGSYLILLAQPQRRNVSALFEPQVYPNRVTAQGDAERPYDVAGWTLPMQLGVDAPAVMSIQEPAGERRLTLVRNVNDVRRDLALPLQTADNSPIVNPVRLPVRIGIYKPWMSNMDEGWTRFVFDTFNVPFESLLDATMRKEDLSSKYDVVILTSQRATQIVEGNAAGTYPAEFTGGIMAAGVANLKKFVESGGTLVCFDAACELPISEFKLPLRNVLAGLRSSDFYCPGSILSLDVDNAQPLARGLSRNVDAYFINSSAFETTDPNVRVIARYAKENVLRSGWLLGEDRLRGQIALAEVKVGSGRVVVFGFRPQHRGQTWGSLPFIWNALHK
ncbi:MAG TPA: M14 metallopeptidase family protein [Pyrinomonadaceae bacterium]|nr:M14 metallopeptidase family protein [Pyrinomonadaceae bacterium]